MKITLIPSVFGANGKNSQYLTSYLINDVIAIDAGAIGFYQGPAEQSAIRHVLLSHSHMDHVASLSIFLENVAGMCPTPVTLHASESVQESLRLDLFNGRIWPNFLELSHDNGRFVDLAIIADGATIEVEGIRITPIAVDHVVPTLGFVLEDDANAIVISSDTGPTTRWERARRTSKLKAVYLECTFPDEMATLAESTKHLTPTSFHGEMRKLPDVPFYAVHLRARFREQIMRELLAPKLPNLEIAKFGEPFQF